MSNGTARPRIQFSIVRLLQLSFWVAVFLTVGRLYYHPPTVGPDWAIRFGLIEEEIKVNWFELIIDTSLVSLILMVSADLLRRAWWLWNNTRDSDAPPVAHPYLWMAWFVVLALLSIASVLLEFLDPWSWFYAGDDYNGLSAKRDVSAHIMDIIAMVAMPICLAASLLSPIRYRLPERSRFARWRRTLLGFGLLAGLIVFFGVVDSILEALILVAVRGMDAAAPTHFYGIYPNPQAALDFGAWVGIYRRQSLLVALFALISLIALLLSLRSSTPAVQVWQRRVGGLGCLIAVFMLFGIRYVSIPTVSPHFDHAIVLPANWVCAVLGTFVLFLASYCMMVFANRVQTSDAAECLAIDDGRRKVALPTFLVAAVGLCAFATVVFELVEAALKSTTHVVAVIAQYAHPVGAFFPLVVVISAGECVRRLRNVDRYCAVPDAESRPMVIIATWLTLATTLLATAMSAKLLGVAFWTWEIH